MKKITGLDQPIKILPSVGEDISKLYIPKFHEVFLTIVANVRGLEGKKTVRLTKIGLMILDAKDSIEFEDADFELLKEVVGMPPGPYASFIMGQALTKLIETELGEHHGKMELLH